MKIICFVVCLLVVSTISNLLHAAQDPSVLPVNTSSKIKILSQHPVWRALLGNNSKKQETSTFSSDFFLAPDGSGDPLKELGATLTAFRQPIATRDNHPQCKYPGRYAWLDQHLSLNELGIKPVSCPQFKTFSSNGQISSISVILVSGFLKNPASYYGHILLKFNTPQHVPINDLENKSINFGANIPADEGMLSYIFKGVWGGYDSSFTTQQFYLHDQLYREIEQRDMWEYELNLPKKDVDLLVAHLWELLRNDYTYYFLNRNCAYRMGELLELVLGDEFVDSLRPWETPQAIVQKLGRMTLDDQPLVRKVSYLPSRQSRLYHRYAKLNGEERTVLNEIVDDIDVLDGEYFSELSLISAQRVLDTLLDYYQLVSNGNRQDKNNKSSYRLVLNKRYQLPPGGFGNVFVSEEKPHLGHMPSYLNLGFINNEELGDILTIRLRPVYYDSLDAGYGHIKNSSLSMGEGTLMLVDGSQLRIKSLELLTIEKLSRNLTGLPGDRAFSWYLNIGAEQQSLAQKDDLIAKANGGVGYAVSNFGDIFTLAAYVGTGYWGSFSQDDEIYVSAKLSLHCNLADSFTFRADAEHREFLGSKYDEQLYKIQVRKTFTPQHDLRIYYAEHLGSEVGFSVGFYW